MSRRRALIIGNNDYLTTPLKNCVNDATKLAEALADVYYTVDLKLNLNSVNMYECIGEFIISIEPNDFIIFFFAGHGVQWGDQNFLFPCDSDQIKTGRDIQHYAISAQDTINEMARMHPQFVLFLLDCCREYWIPKEPNTRGNGQPSGGLKEMIPPLGTMIAFACAAGETAFDQSSASENGIFTKCLLKHITTPDTDIEHILRRVAKDVMKEQINTQQPFRLSSITEENVFIVSLGKYLLTVSIDS